MKLRNYFSNRFIHWLTKEAPAKYRPLSSFDRMRYEIRPGDVILVEGRSRVSEVIKFLTKSPWSHAALYIGRLADIQDIAMRKKVAHFCKHSRNNEPLLIEGMLGQGFIVNPLSIYKDDHMRICRPKGITYTDVQDVINYTIEALGKGYSARHIFDLARFLLPWRILPKRWGSILFRYRKGGVSEEICSSLIASAFDKVNFPILPHLKTTSGTTIKWIRRNPLLFTPSDFDYSPFFEIVKYPIFEEGSYQNLPWSNEDSITDDTQ